MARCTVARVMRAMGLAGAVRGRAWITTTHAGEGGRPVDLVDRQFVTTRPNQLWVSDFTYVATWSGFVYVAFVIDVLARRMVGWRVAAFMRTDFVLDAVEQAIYARRDDPLNPASTTYWLQRNPVGRPSPRSYLSLMSNCADARPYSALRRYQATAST